MILSFNCLSEDEYATTSPVATTSPYTSIPPAPTLTFSAGVEPALKLTLRPESVGPTLAWS